MDTKKCVLAENYHHQMCDRVYWMFCQFGLRPKTLQKKEKRNFSGKIRWKKCFSFLTNSPSTCVPLLLIFPHFKMINFPKQSTPRDDFLGTSWLVRQTRILTGKSQGRNPQNFLRKIHQIFVIFKRFYKAIIHRK